MEVQFYNSEKWYLPLVPILKEHMNSVFIKLNKATKGDKQSLTGKIVIPVYQSINNKVSHIYFSSV